MFDSLRDQCAGQVRNCSGPKQALFPLIISVWNGALAGPGLTLTAIEIVGNKMLSGLFIITVVLTPIGGLLSLTALWCAPCVRTRGKWILLWLALALQSWNGHDILVTLMFVYNSDLTASTGAQKPLC